MDACPSRPVHEPQPWPHTLMKQLQRHPKLCASLLAVISLFAASTSFAQICTREYAPVCGQVAGEPAPRTFPNRCMLDAAKATFLSEGECKAVSMSTPQPVLMPLPGSDVDAHGCKASAGFQWNEELNQCVRPWMSSAVTLEVAPKRRRCTGVVEMQCLMVREWVREGAPGQAAPRWEPLFGSIAGFKHVSGKHHTLRVRKDKLENPPADAPSIIYTLLTVVR
jgi:Domain of unknown function (DUF4377)